MSGQIQSSSNPEYDALNMCSVNKGVGDGVSGDIGDSVRIIGDCVKGDNGDTRTNSDGVSGDIGDGVRVIDDCVKGDNGDTRTSSDGVSGDSGDVRMNNKCIEVNGDTLTIVSNDVRRDSDGVNGDGVNGDGVNGDGVNGDGDGVNGDGVNGDGDGLTFEGSMKGDGVIVDGDSVEDDSDDSDVDVISEGRGNTQEGDGGRRHHPPRLDGVEETPTGVEKSAPPSKDVTLSEVFEIDKNARCVVIHVFFRNTV